MPDKTNDAPCLPCLGKGYIGGDECPYCQGTGDRYGRGPTLAPPSTGEEH